MKRALGVTLSVAVLATVSLGEAKPGGAEEPPRATPANLAPETYYKPSRDGSDTTVIKEKEKATVSCASNPQKPESNFKIVIANGQAYCKVLFTVIDNAPLKCEDGKLVIDAPLAPTVKATFKQPDACLKTGAPADVASSYSEPKCGTSSTGSGHIRQVKPGADTCDKAINGGKLQTPGDPGSALTLPTVIGVGKEVVPTQAQIDSKALKCPANTTLEQSGNGAVCRR